MCPRNIPASNEGAGDRLTPMVRAVPLCLIGAMTTATRPAHFSAGRARRGNTLMSPAERTHILRKARLEIVRAKQLRRHCSEAVVSATQICTEIAAMRTTVADSRIPSPSHRIGGLAEHSLLWRQPLDSPLPRSRSIRRPHLPRPAVQFQPNLQSSLQAAQGRHQSRADHGVRGHVAMVQAALRRVHG
jgi:hypothetical protein